MVTTTNVPSQVQVVFSLRDQNGHAIVLPAQDVQEATRIFEIGPGTDGFEEIDYTETSFFVHTAENFDLEVVFVLDLTNSMVQTTLPDGRNGIDAVIEAFESGLSVLPGAHRIGGGEFHDRNADPGVLSTLTTDRRFLMSLVRQFMESGFDPGSSRVWDSIVTGVNLFSSRQQNPRAIRSLVFISDGRDTSSANVREDAERYAREHGVQLYAMGVGEVFQVGELKQMASATNGAYYPAPDPALLQQQLQLIVNDLRGQYQVSYITLRRQGEYRAVVEIELDGVAGTLETRPFDVASFLGSDDHGVVSLDPLSIDREGNLATTFMRMLHTHANVAHAAEHRPAQIQARCARSGGRCGACRSSGRRSAGWMGSLRPRC